jgi:hypothetical protein
MTIFGGVSKLAELFSFILRMCSCHDVVVAERHLGNADRILAFQ